VNAFVHINANINKKYKSILSVHMQINKPAWGHDFGSPVVRSKTYNHNV